MQAKLEENARNSEALSRASDQTANNWANGNYIEGSKPLINEFAKQGNKTGVIATAAAGAGLKILDVVLREKEAKRIAEEKRQQELSRQRKIQKKKDAILKAQKAEFNVLANGIKSEKKAIIAKRKSIIEIKPTYLPTYNLKPKNHSPIYFFYIEVNKEYNRYSENIAFPNKIEVIINENPKIKFSPVIAVYPKSNGEFAFVKDIVADIKSKFLTNTNSSYVLFNWEDSYESINVFYDQIIKKASNANFELKLPEDSLIDLKKEKSTTDFSYWSNNSGIDNAKQSDSTGNSLSYWNKNNIKINQKELSKENNNINYWNSTKKNNSDKKE